MGFFDFLSGGKKRTNVEVIPERIWLSTEAKFSGLTKEVEERSKSDAVAIMLVAHFRDVLKRLERIADQLESDVPVQAVLASNLSKDLAASLNLDDTSVIDLIVGERHPLSSVDERLIAFADELPCRCRMTHHLSLDDPVMEVFADPWVQNLLRKLGMSEDEAIESQMVTKRISQAQKKIEQKSHAPLDAESARDWMERNCPGLLDN